MNRSFSARWAADPFCFFAIGNWACPTCVSKGETFDKPIGKGKAKADSDSAASLLSAEEAAILAEASALSTLTDSTEAAAPLPAEPLTSAPTIESPVRDPQKALVRTPGIQRLRNPDWSFTAPVKRDKSAAGQLVLGAVGDGGFMTGASKTNGSGKAGKKSKGKGKGREANAAVALPASAPEPQALQPPASPGFLARLGMGALSRFGAVAAAATGRNSRTSTSSSNTNGGAANQNGKRKRKRRFDGWQGYDNLEEEEWGLGRDEEDSSDGDQNRKRKKGKGKKDYPPPESEDSEEEEENAEEEEEESTEEEEEEEKEDDPFGGILVGEDADTTRAKPSDQDKRRFEQAKKQGEQKLGGVVPGVPDSSLPPVKSLSSTRGLVSSAGTPKGTPNGLAGPSVSNGSAASYFGSFVSRAASAALGFGHVPGSPSSAVSSPAPREQTPGTPVPSEPTAVPATAAETGIASAVKCIRFEEYDIDTWYQAPFPEEYSLVPDGRMWICEFCLKYMKSRFMATRHRVSRPHPRRAFVAC